VLGIRITFKFPRLSRMTLKPYWQRWIIESKLKSFVTSCYHGKKAARLYRHGSSPSVVYVKKQYESFRCVWVAIPGSRP
jgi:hypothetical protein